MQAQLQTALRQTLMAATGLSLVRAASTCTSQQASNALQISHFAIAFNIKPLRVNAREARPRMQAARLAWNGA